MKLRIVVLVLALVGIILFVVRWNSVEEFSWSDGEYMNPKVHYSVMTVNVGNSNLLCFEYKWKLCKKDVEQRLAKNLQAIKPDIIAIQEVLAPWQCEQEDERNRNKVCSDSQDVPQVRRLLGDDYSIVCDSRMNYECIAVRVDAGEIIGSPVGDLSNMARTSPELPDCDPGFTISAATVRLNNGAVFDVVNIHPTSFSDECRAQMFRQAFSTDDSESPLIKEEKVLIMGDFNLDPWRSTDESTEVWGKIFNRGWDGKDFRYHSGIVEKDPPHYTLVFVVRKTLDVVLSNFASGVCQVLGETEGTSRLDGGSGCDHRAVYGVLEIKP